jgi:hypothetical protein
VRFRDIIALEIESPRFDASHHGVSVDSS